MFETVHPIIYEDETGQLSLEIAPDGRAFIHCYIYQWSKEGYKRQKEVWIAVLGALQELGYSEIYAATMNKKLQKFASMFGFELTGEIVRSSGGEREVMICRD